MHFKKQAKKMTNYRWTICAMLFFATTVNYLDRQVLSLTWDEFIKPEFHWDESHYGTITSVFSLCMQSVCCLRPFYRLDWVRRKDIFGLWCFGRSEPVSMPVVVFATEHLCRNE